MTPSAVDGEPAEEPTPPRHRPGELVAHPRDPRRGSNGARRSSPGIGLRRAPRLLGSLPLPYKPPRACRCGALVPAGQRCPRCYPAWATRPASWAGGSTRRWRRLRAAKLAADPLCQWPDCVRLADEVDHIRPLHLFGEGPERETARYDWANLRSLCVPHHRRLTQEQARRARQAGGRGA